MRWIGTSIPNVLLIELRIFRDDGGFFLKTYHATKNQAAGVPHAFVQDNNSGSYSLTFGGLNYQIRQSQGKLVRALAGDILDVTVDLHRFSPTFEHWTGGIIQRRKNP